MKQTRATLLRREKQLERFSRIEHSLPFSSSDPGEAIAGIGWLCEMLPEAIERAKLVPVAGEQIRD